MTNLKTDRPDLLISAHSKELSGGAEIALFSMIKYLYTQGLKIHLLSPDKGDFTGELGRVAPDITISYLGQPWWMLGDTDPNDFQLTNIDPTHNVTGSIVKLIKEIKPKLCVTNTIAAPWLAYAAAITDTPHAWLIHEMGLNFKSYMPRHDILENIDALSDKVFCNSAYTAMYYQQFLRYNQDIGVVYPLSERKVPDSKVPTPFRESGDKFIMVGAIVPQKGQADAIRAIHELNTTGTAAQLVIVGKAIDENYYHQLKKYCKDNGLEDKVRFVGVKSNPASYVQYADAVLMCSEGEAFGLATVEGMLLGKPVIGADDAGTPEIIKDGQTGLLYKLHDVQDLVKKMRLLITDKNLAKKLGKTAQKYAERHFSPATSYSEFMEYIKLQPLRREALNLAPLSSMLDDYEAAMLLLRNEITLRDQRIQDIFSSKSWRLITILRKLLRK